MTCFTSFYFIWLTVNYPSNGKSNSILPFSMPPPTRKARCDRLLKYFLKHCKDRLRRTYQRAKRQRQRLRAAELTAGDLYASQSSGSGSDNISIHNLSTSSISLSSSNSTTDSSLDTDSQTSDSSGYTASSQTASDLENAFREVKAVLDVMPDLVALDPDSDDDSESEYESSDDSMDGGFEEDGWDEEGSENDADIEDSDVEDMGQSSMLRLGRRIRVEISEMYSERYEEPHDVPIPRPPAQMPHVLRVLKHERPDHFREILRVSPVTFDRIVDGIKDDPVFTNESNNPQLPVEEQVAIALYRFGHDGNAAGHAAVARWAGAGRGSPSLHTKCVLTAVLRHDFMEQAVCFPTEEEKEEAKAWVEAHLCHAWRDGWLMVDGTLIPLFDRPFWYGESYFDRKCNYSLNIQVWTTSNAHIGSIYLSKSRLSLSQTFALWISAMVILEALMTPQHGRTLVLLRNMILC